MDLISGSSDLVLICSFKPFHKISPANIQLFKVGNRNTRQKCEICLNSTIETPEQRHWRRFGVFTVNFEHISHIF